MNKLKIKKFGFTLIELLVVISIIGLLATILIANLSSMRGRARDAVRKSDLSQLVSALRLYYNDKTGYPCSSCSGSHRICACGSGFGACNWGTDPLTSGGTSPNIYISLLPTDPQSTTTQYRYDADSTCPALATRFILSAFLENVSDSDILRSQSRCQTVAIALGVGLVANQYVLCSY